MLVTATHLVDWADTKEAQTQLPRLIRRLCFNVEATREISFPAGDSTHRPGWDGVLLAERGSAWVPQGRSYWEMGCNQNVSKKAEQDLRKRTDSTDEEQQRGATFVFVTPRRWQGKSAWIEKVHSSALWADVRAYDADDLEQWIEQTPAVAVQFAEELGLAGWGVVSP